MGCFWSQKSIKMRLMSFSFLLILYWFFHYFCVLGGLMLVLYRFFLRIVFCIDFWSIWDRFWSPFGSLWGVQIDHFWHQFWDDFCMSFQERPKSAQERPKSAQERPKSAQEGPKRGQERPKSGPRGAQERPRGAQERPQSTQ